MEALRNKVREMLEDKSIEGFLGLRHLGSEPLPYLFTRQNTDALEQLTTGNVRYPLSKILLTISQKYPDSKFAVMCRACDERSIIELVKNAQLDSEKIIVLGISCSDELQKACNCKNPNPSNLVVGEPVQKRYDDSELQNVKAMDVDRRFEFWMENLGRCIKCYGCRNICPVCFCKVCTLEDTPLVQTGEIPPEVPGFHLVRAFHMVGRCIDCGLCEEGCPVNIPLRTIYRRVREIVSELFNYIPGEEKDSVSPIQVLGDGTFELR